MEYYSAIKKTMSFAATWMDLEVIILSEIVRQRRMSYHLYMESKVWYKRTYLKKKKKPRHRKQTYGYQSGKEVEEG